MMDEQKAVKNTGIPLEDEQMDQVIGGVTRTVNTHTDAKAVIKSGAGIACEQVALLGNGTRVNTTGETCEKDGKTWYKIDYPVDGWIVGSKIGY